MSFETSVHPIAIRLQLPDVWPKVCDWSKWFAWRPVYIHKNLHWMQYVYRRKLIYREDVAVRGVHEYGTLFDVMLPKI